jgi:hypothetical protein
MHETESYITLTQAAKLAPGRPSINCIWRWCRKGVLARSGQRIRLQHVRIGGKLFTTATWVTQFGLALAEADVNYFNLDSAPTLPQQSLNIRTDKQRQAAIEHAQRDLAEMGV